MFLFVSSICFFLFFKNPNLLADKNHPLYSALNLISRTNTSEMQELYQDELYQLYLQVSAHLTQAIAHCGADDFRIRSILITAQVVTQHMLDCVPLSSEPNEIKIFEKELSEIKRTVQKAIIIITNGCKMATLTSHATQPDQKELLCNEVWDFVGNMQSYYERTSWITPSQISTYQDLWNQLAKTLLAYRQEQKPGDSEASEEFRRALHGLCYYLDNSCTQENTKTPSEVILQTYFFMMGPSTFKKRFDDFFDIFYQSFRFPPKYMGSPVVRLFPLPTSNRETAI